MMETMLEMIGVFTVVFMVLCFAVGIYFTVCGALRDRKATQFQRGVDSFERATGRAWQAPYGTIHAAAPRNRRYCKH
jgi:cbb3-type cytochrome oxidase subunit 3